MKKKAVNELNHNYLGRKFNKLTVIDIHYDDSKKICYLHVCANAVNNVINTHTLTNV